MNKFTFSLLIALFIAFSTLYYEISSKSSVLEKPALRIDAPLQLISEKNNALFDSAYALLAQAKHSILIMNYAYDNPEILKILNQKAKEGVSVTVVFDRGTSSNWILRLNPAIRKVTRWDGEGYVHHKIIVVDGEYIWFSSANFNAFNAKNITLAFQSPEMANVITREMEAIAGKKIRINPRPFKSVIDGQEMELFILPHHDPKEFQPVEAAMNEIGRKKLLGLINQAKTSIRASVVVFTYKDVARALVNAANRGVNVELMGANLERDVQRILEEGNIPVKRVRGPYHHKWMLIDDKILWNGSANWSVSAFSRTDDSVIVLHDLTPAQLAFLDGVWQSLLQDSH